MDPVLAPLQIGIEAMELAMEPIANFHSHSKHNSRGDGSIAICIRTTPFQLDARFWQCFVRIWSKKEKKTQTNQQEKK